MCINFIPLLAGSWAGVLDGLSGARAVSWWALAGPRRVPEDLTRARTHFHNHRKAWTHTQTHTHTRAQVGYTPPSLLLLSLPINSNNRARGWWRGAHAGSGNKCHWLVTQTEISGGGFSHFEAHKQCFKSPDKGLWYGKAKYSEIIYESEQPVCYLSMLCPPPTVLSQSQPVPLSSPLEVGGV